MFRELILSMKEHNSPLLRAVINQKT
jgi:hypothetical protein